MKPKAFVLAVICAVLPILANAKVYMKYGKISDEELKMTVCPFDSNASAVVLGDLGNSSFHVTQDNITIQFKRHLRIKIFDKESFDKGNFKIYLYKSLDGTEEKLTSIKGTVYNVKEGKLVKSKLSNENIHRDEADKNHNLVSVSMPDIQEGSIIELAYSIENPYIFNLQSWYFQDDIPTIYSEYRVGIIEWYDYKNWIEGYFKVNLDEETRNESFSFLKSSSIAPGLGGGRTSGGNVQFNADVRYKTFSGQNIPAFKNEPYITTPSDYLSSVQFELRSTRYPWAIYKNYTHSWSGINKMLLDHSDFGGALKADGHLKDAAAKILSTATDPVHKAAMAQAFIKNTIAWDGRYRKYVDRSLRNAFNNHTGNSSDINLNLVALCRLAGLNAQPAIISTRGHGKIRPGLVSVTQFNHVLAAVNIDGKYLLMDATDKNCPYNLLPPQCLNGKGRIVVQGEGKWVDLYSTKQWDELYLVNLNFDEDFNLSGKLVYKAQDYAALSFRKRYKKEESEKDFVVELENDLEGAEFTDYEIENIDSLQKPIKMTVDIVFKNKVNKAGDMVFFNPKLIDLMTKNVFKREERTYPIDYNYPYKEQYIINITLPDGYTFEEVPEQIAMGLPDQKAKYIFSVRAIGNKISLTNQFLINQTIFPGVEYQDLKKFYEMIVSKEAEQVVLKKL